MADLLYLGIIIAFFALMVLFVRWCERIVGTDEGTETTGGPAPSDTDAREEVLA